MAQPTVAPSRALTPIDEIRGTLTKMGNEFKMALPPHIPVERFIRVAMTAIQSNPNLINGDRKALYGAFVKAAQDGLLPDGREGAIVPYKGSAAWLPMVQGICKKARNSGEISSIDAQVVYQNDYYEAWVDEKGQHFKHIKARSDRGAAILTYAYAITKDGGFYFEEVDETQMAAIEKMSRASDGPWKGPFRDEMRRKSAIRRLAKYRLPSSTDLDQVIQRDDDLYNVPSAEETVKPEPPTKSTRLSKVVAAQVVPPLDAEKPGEVDENPNVDDLPI